MQNHYLIRTLLPLSITLTFILLITGCQSDEAKNQVNTPPKSDPIDKANIAPSVDAGKSQNIQTSTSVNLSGSASDSDGTVSSFLWKQISGPGVLLTSENTKNASFVAPQVTEQTTLTFQLTVVDSGGASSNDTVDIVISPPQAAQNLAPTVDAGENQIIQPGTMIELIGSANDSDGTISTFLWESISDNTITLTNQDKVSASFIAPIAAEEKVLTFKLTVTDNNGNSSSDSVEITIIPTTIEIGTKRSNPIPQGQTLDVVNWKIKITETIRGDEAWKLIQEENQFNSPPLTNYEYILVRIDVTSTATDNEAHSIDRFNFRITGDKLIKYSYTSLVLPEPKLDADLFSGGQASGWTAFQVVKNETNLILVYEPSIFLSPNWFMAVDNHAKLEVANTLNDIQSTSIGNSRQNSAKFGEQVTTEDWQVKIIEILRGDNAWQKIDGANQFNDKPEPGMEYLLAKVNTRYIGTEDTDHSSYTLDFRSVGSLNVLYDSPIIVEPEPALNANLYPGGEIEGWVTLSIAIGEALPVMEFGPLFSYDNKNRRYLNLYTE